MLLSKPVNTPRCKIPKTAGPGLLGKEMHNARREMTFQGLLCTCPQLTRSEQITLWGHLIVGDFRQQSPKVSCPQGLCGELEYENAGWRNQTRTGFPPGARLCCDGKGWAVKWRLGNFSKKLAYRFHLISKELTENEAFLVFFRDFFLLLFLKEGSISCIRGRVLQKHRAYLSITLITEKYRLHLTQQL